MQLNKTSCSKYLITHIVMSYWHDLVILSSSWDIVQILSFLLTFLWNKEYSKDPVVENFIMVMIFCFKKTTICDNFTEANHVLDNVIFNQSNG